MPLGASPIEAVATAKRELLSGSLQVAGKPAKDAFLHPGVWTLHEAWIAVP